MQAHEISIRFEGYAARMVAERMCIPHKPSEIWSQTAA
jgi:hypothetical protein